MIIKHIDLFSGLGGFSYALDTIFYEYETEHTFSDNNPFCQAVLKKNWPEARIVGDIRTLTNPKGEGDQGVGLERKPYQEAAKAEHNSRLAANASSGESNRRKKGKLGKTECGGQGGHATARSGDQPFVLTGGFPCQPFSAAGLRKGTEDNRYLWPEMFRVIREFQPRWVVAENVRGLATWNDGMVLEQVCADLESEGYEVQPLIIPAVAVNAPHRRDRIWFVANRHGSGSQEPGAKLQTKRYRQGDQNASDASSAGGRGRGRENSGRADHPEKRNPPGGEGERRDWDRSWLEVATELCSVDDGLPGRMGDVTITKARHRNEQLKAYGNAIVPQVAMEIFKAIKQTEGL